MLTFVLLLMLCFSGLSQWQFSYGNSIIILMNCFESFILLLLCLSLSHAIECPQSHFDFLGRYSLGKQDELTRAFQKIQQKIALLPEVFYTSPDNATYIVYNAKPVFYYRDSQQQADILGDDIIVIFGGKLQVTIAFQWSRRGGSAINGSGTALGISDMITFAKRAVVENGSFYSYELVNSANVSWTTDNAFSLSRIDPPNLTDADRDIITKMFNEISGTKTVKNVLGEEIDKIYSYYLRASLHDEHMPIDDHFDYTWVPGWNQPNVTIPFSRRAIGIDLEKLGVQLTFDIQVKDYSGWQCSTQTLPSAPLNPKIYGSSQQFVTLDFYKNAIQYAISSNILDAELTRERWQSRMFQFYAGDLYEVFSNVENRFFAADQASGNCKANSAGLKLQQGKEDTFNVSLTFNCELRIKTSKISDFSVGLVLEVQGIPTSTALNFRLKSHTESVTFSAYSDYRILQQQLGRTMISHSINRLYQGNLFGSGWPLSPPRDSPRFLTFEDYTVIFDSSQIDPRNDS